MIKNKSCIGRDYKEIVATYTHIIKTCFNSTVYEREIKTINVFLLCEAVRRKESENIVNKQRIENMFELGHSPSLVN